MKGYFSNLKFRETAYFQSLCFPCFCFPNDQLRKKQQITLRVLRVDRRMARQILPVDRQIPRVDRGVLRVGRRLDRQVLPVDR